MSDSIYCPRCGSSNVECQSKPHVHRCHDCGYDGTKIAGEGTEAPCTSPRATDAEASTEAPLPGSATDLGDSVCPSCGNWRAHDGFPGNHDPDCPLIERWTVVTQGNNATALIDNGVVAARFYLPWGEPLARRVAAALNGTPDLTALADALAEYDRWQYGVDRRRSLVQIVDAARALVASTGTETDDAR